MGLVSIHVQDEEYMTVKCINSNEESVLPLEGHTTYHAKCKQSHRIVSDEVVGQSESIGTTDTRSK